MEAVLILNPAINHLSTEVYCCFIKKPNKKFDIDTLKYLNQGYSSFVEAVNLVSFGEIESLDNLPTNNSNTRVSYRSTEQAITDLKDKCSNLYIYDTSEKKYRWVKLS